MKHFIFWAFGWLLLGLASNAQAQGEYLNWYFGNQAGITFLSNPPVGLTDGQLSFPEGAGCMSDSAGRFLFASDGQYVWDRQWQRMPGRVSPHPVVGFSSRQVLAVRQPGRFGRYYVFRNSNQFVASQYPVSVLSNTHLPYAIVDIKQRSGFGAVVANDSIRLPNWTNHATAPYYYLNTNWVAIRHSNGLDVWITGQTDEGRYVSCLLSAAGVGPPVVSLTPREILSAANGILRASTDGKTLVSVQYIATRTTAITQLEVARFDPSTGRVTAYDDLPSPFRGRIINGPGPSQYSIYFVRMAGLELSPDGSRLYADTVNSSGVFQYNLLAGSPAAVQTSRAAVPVQIQNGQGFSDSGDLQLGPDGNIYVIRSSFVGVGRIEQANALAPFCRFVADGVRYRKGGAPARYTFPTATNDLDLPPVVITGGGTIRGQAGCVGELMPFASTLSPFVTATAYAWDFGDPASGPSNQATGQAPTHRYQQAGTYTVRLVIMATSGQVFVTSQQVQVWPLPVVELGPNLSLCADEPRTLSAGPQPTGSTYRWHDGSIEAEFSARLTGTYRVTVTSPQGCVATDELTVQLADCPQLPNIITPNGDAQNQTFILKGLNAPDWTLHLYNRWGREIYQQAHYDNSWAALGQPDGVYYYLLTNATTGQKIKGWLEVRR